MKKLMILSFFGLAASLSFGAIRAVTPTAWPGGTNSWQMKRHYMKMDLVKAGGAPIVFIGDSITHFWESSGYGAWLKYFSGEGTPYHAINLGTSADRTEHVLWRLTEGGELDGYEAKIVLLMIGTNNTGHFPFEKETPMDTILGIREILKVIREKQPTAKVVLTAIFPRGADPTDELRKRNEVVNKEICKFADGQNVFWVNFNEQMLTPEGVLPREVFPDLLHPAAFGYELWFAAVKPYIDYALSDGKLPPPPNRYAECVRLPAYGNENRTLNPVTRIMERHSERGLDWWSSRLLEKRNQIVAADGQFDLVMFGDSITHYWEYAQGREAYAVLTNTYKVLNIGYGGDRTEHLLWRGRYGELTGYTAKCFMMMIGTNNAYDKPEAVAEGIKRNIELIHEKQPQAKVLLLPIFPRGHVNDQYRLKNEKVNTIIKGYADGQRVFWLDFNAALLDPDGEAKSCFLEDLLHPNARGYDVWLKAILPELKRLIP